MDAVCAHRVCVFLGLRRLSKDRTVADCIRAIHKSRRRRVACEVHARNYKAHTHSLFLATHKYAVRHHNHNTCARSRPVHDRRGVCMRVCVFALLSTSPVPRQPSGQAARHRRRHRQVFSTTFSPFGTAAVARPPSNK